MVLTAAQRTWKESGSAVYTATLSDAAGVTLIKSRVDSLTLTLYDVETLTIINSRNAQNVLDANQVTMHATSGLVTWSVLPADNAIVTTGILAGELEAHLALFRCTYDTTQQITHELTVFVKQSAKVT